MQRIISIIVLVLTVQVGNAKSSITGHRPCETNIEPTCLVEAAEDTTSAPLNKILKLVTESLQELKSKSQVLSVKPGKVSVTFKTESTQQTGAGIKILIFNFGKKWEKVRTNEVTFNYKLEKPESFAKAKMSDQLALALNNALTSASKATKVDDLVLTGFSVQISFSVQKSTDVGAEYEIIPLPVTPKLSKSWKNKAIHTIKITFE